MPDLDRSLPRDWPSGRLRIELCELNRNWMRSTSNPHAALKDRESWPNQHLDRFAEELADSKKAGVVVVAAGSPEFQSLMESGQRFSWVVLLDGSLRVCPTIVTNEAGSQRISHAILVEGGGEVLAAGEGRAGDFLSNTTGHYKNEDIVLGPVKRAFAEIGIVFTR